LATADLQSIEPRKAVMPVVLLHSAQLTFKPKAARLA
jgi:hypothetical protein